MSVDTISELLTYLTEDSDDAETAEVVARFDIIVSLQQGQVPCPIPHALRFDGEPCGRCGAQV